MNVRIRVGLEEYCFDTGPTLHGGEPGQPLRPRDAVQLVRQLGARELRQLAGLVTPFGRRETATPAEQQRVLNEQLLGGRVRVHRIAAELHRTTGKIPLPIEHIPPPPIDNEIPETHGVMIELIDAEGNPVPSEPFRIKLPDGTVETGTLDGEGKAHITGIPRAGNCKVCFYERDAAIWDQV